MINSALGFLQKELDNYFVLLGERDIDGESLVVVDRMSDPDGSILFDDLGMVLVNIEEERIHKAQTPYTTTSDGVVKRINPEIKLNLYVLIAAYSAEKHDTALTLLGNVIEFFQMKHVFTPHTAPDLPTGIQKLVVEMITLTFEQQNHLWGTLGAKYMPSVLYKVRLLSVQKSSEAPAALVREVSTNESGIPR